MITDDGRAELARQSAALNTWAGGVVRSRTAERTAGLRKQAPITAHERDMIDAMRRTMTRGSAMPANWIARQTGQTPQGASRVLASCVRKGLVTRWPGRRVRFALTRKGWDLARTRAEQHRATGGDSHAEP